MAGAKASAGSLYTNKEVWEHNGAAASVRTLISKAVLSTQEVRVVGEGLNPYPTEWEPRAAHSELCGLFSCLWMALLTQRGCLCAHALFYQLPLHSSLLSVGLQRLDRLIGPQFCTCQTAAACYRLSLLSTSLALGLLL